MSNRTLADHPNTRGTAATKDLGPAPDNVPTNQQLADGVERSGGDTAGISSVVFAKEINQGTTGDQVLLLCRVTEEAFISGTITGTRQAGSGVANRSSVLDIFVRLGTDGSPSVGFVTGGGLDGWSINPTNLITTEYNNETYVAIKASGSSASAGFDRAVFTGVNTNGVFQWISDADALNQQDFSGPSASFFGRPGDIVESGSNGNGSYVRWENGEQLCLVQFTGKDLRTATAQGALWRTGDLGWAFPANFATNGYAVSGHPRALSGNRHKWVTAIGAHAATESTFTFRVMSSDEDTSSDSEQLALSAWGFWK